MSVQGVERVIKRLSDISIAARAGIGTALAQSVVEMDGYAKKKIHGGSRSGRFYARRGVTHQASAPGEFPKTDRGQLVASLFFQVAADKLSAMFGTKILYGKHLEYGTSNMAPRPWLRPTFKANLDAARARVRAAVEAALRG